MWIFTCLVTFVEKILNSSFKLYYYLSVLDVLMNRSLHFPAKLGEEGGKGFVLSLGLIVGRSCTIVCFA